MIVGEAIPDDYVEECKELLGQFVSLLEAAQDRLLYGNNGESITFAGLIEQYTNKFNQL